MGKQRSECEGKGGFRKREEGGYLKTIKKDKRATGKEWKKRERWREERN